MSLVDEALKDVETLFLDTAPIIYFVEGKEPFVNIARPIFQKLSNGLFTAVISPVTLAECLYFPYKHANTALLQKFTTLLTRNPQTQLLPTTAEIASRAAYFRVTYNLHLLDAIQVATAVTHGCSAFLTNDKQLRRVTELNILVLDDLTV